MFVKLVRAWVKMRKHGKKKRTGSKLKGPYKFVRYKDHTWTQDLDDETCICVLQDANE